MTWFIEKMLSLQIVTRQGFVVIWLIVWCRGEWVIGIVRIWVVEYRENLGDDKIVGGDWWDYDADVRYFVRKWIIARISWALQTLIRVK